MGGLASAQKEPDNVVEINIPHQKGGMSTISIFSPFLTQNTEDYFPDTNIKAGKEPKDGLKIPQYMLIIEENTKIAENIQFSTVRGLVAEHLIEQNNSIGVRQKVQEEKKYPYSCVGVIIGSYPTQVQNEKECFRGSGFMVGPNIILTCAHNYYNHKYKSFATDLKFYPGVRCGKKNISTQKSYKIKQSYIPQQYKQVFANSDDSFQYDYAIMELEENIGDIFGYLGFDSRKTNVGIEDKFQMLGYPSNRENQVQYQMYTTKGKAIDVDEDYIVYRESTAGGQSGGPIIVERGQKCYAVGIHVATSSGNKNPPKNYANHLTNGKRCNINKWIGKNYFDANLQWQKIGGGDSIKKLLLDDKCIRIKKLNLGNNQITDEQMKLLSENRTFGFTTQVNLKFNQIKNEGLQYLQCFPSLIKLDLYKNLLENQAVFNLTQLNFEFLQELNLGSNKIGDDPGYQRLNKMKNLKKLKLQNTHISDQGIEILYLDSPIELINLSNNKEVTDFSLLSDFKSLREIDFSSNNIGDKGLKGIKNGDFPNLEKLSFSRNDLSDQSVGSIILLKELVQLKLNQNKFTEQGVQKMITSLQRLQYFEVSNKSQVTHLSADYLKKIKQKFSG